MNRKQKRYSVPSVLVVIALLLASGSALGDTHYVPDDFGTIQAALEGASGGDTIIVRNGTYTGDGNNNLDFKNKAVTLRSENGAQNCIINCMGEARGFYFHSGETSASILDGFAVINGNATGGGGIHCTSMSSPTITNCIISGNSAVSGGGIYCYALSSPTITDCIISGNSAGNAGGIYCYESSPTITNCLIINNTVGDSLYENGGGIWCSSSSPTITNCTISGNTALDGGGGIWAASSSFDITDCILWGDSAAYGPEITLFADCSVTVSYSDVEGGETGVFVGSGSTFVWGAGSIDDNPLFVTGPLAGYYLSQVAAGQGADSPCVDAGSDTAANLGLDSYTTRKDHIGDAGWVDMGYHYGLLTQINLASPSDQLTLSSPPTFSWTADGQTHNAFAVDASLSPGFAKYWSTYEHMHQLIYNASWTMPTPIWNMIPPGRRIYWRVRGADLNRTPLAIVTSDEVWSFYKQ